MSIAIFHVEGSCRFTKSQANRSTRVDGVDLIVCLLVSWESFKSPSDITSQQPT